MPADRPGPVIRRAGPGDAAALSALVEAAYTHWVEVIGRRPTPMDDDYGARCAAGQAWLLEEDDAPLGGIVIEDKKEHLFIYNVVVAPERQHQGVGRALLRFAEDEARQRGYGEVGLRTSEGMARNVAIYKQYGYIVTERIPGGDFDRLAMTKRL
jgi:GNAT superfamily N-acetyltransferase